MEKESFAEAPSVISQTVDSTSSQQKKFSMKSTVINILLFLSGFIAILGIVAVIFPQIWKVTYTKIILSSNESEYVHEIIQRREITIQNIAPSEPITDENLTIATPWGKSMNVSHPSPNSTEHHFQNSKSITITNSTFALDYRSELQKSEEAFRENFGEDAWNSDVQMRRIILNTTPNELRVTEPKTFVFLQAQLLILKLASISKASETGIYEYHHGKNTIFQFGDPQKAKKIMIEIYNPSGIHRTIIITGATQQEIDFIVSSVQIK